VPALNLTLRHREAGGPLRELGRLRPRGRLRGPEAGAGQPGVDEVLYQLHRSGLRGRGGRRLPMGAQGELPPQAAQFRKYLVCKRRESEPAPSRTARSWRWTRSSCGGHNARGYAIGAERATSTSGASTNHHARCWRRRFRRGPARRLPRHRDPPFPVRLRRHPLTGARAAYICARRRRCWESWRQTRPARLKPPFPAVGRALTPPRRSSQRRDLASVPTDHRARRRTYAALGTEKSPGTKVFSVPGTSCDRGNYEAGWARPPCASWSSRWPAASAGPALQGLLAGRPRACPCSRAAPRHAARLRVAHAAGTFLGSGG